MGVTATSNPPQAASSPERHEVVVIGAGGSRLAVAALLARACVDTVVLERSAVDASWRSRYERLHLHTHRLVSGYPGWPRRAHWARGYLATGSSSTWRPTPDTITWMCGLAWTRCASIAAEMCGAWQPRRDSSLLATW